YADPVTDPTPTPDPRERRRPWWRRVHPLDVVRVGLLMLGLLAVATGVLPWTAAKQTGARVGPLLVFLAGVVVLAELAAKAQVFDLVAERVARLAGGRTTALFALSVALASATTAFLNLDTTAVLLTPVLIAVAVRVGLPPLPAAMTTVWLANAASLLLPVSNLTNLLAHDTLGMTPTGFAARMVLPQVASVVVVAFCLWIFYWRGAPPRFTPPERSGPRHPQVFVAASVACMLFVAAVVADVDVAIAAPVAAAVVVAAYLVWDRDELTWDLLPWRLLVLVVGLFLVVDTLGRLGVSDAMAAAIGTDSGAAGVGRAAAVGGVLANLLNNLPVYLAGEAVVPHAHTDQLLGLLIGVNVGPIVLPWGTLATLIWAERCHAAGVGISWRRFALTGLVTAVVATVAATAALLV
ncbi:MAG: hypothetical protein J2O46_09360, partial [Nocardioides sp.]|nr:hypothetical protein [Nocardioides sp.]